MDIKVPQTFPIAPWNANLNKLFLIALEIIKCNLENYTRFYFVYKRIELSLKKVVWQSSLRFRPYALFSRIIARYQSYRFTYQHKVSSMNLVHARVSIFPGLFQFSSPGTFGLVKSWYLQGL